VLQSRVLRRKFGHKREEVIGSWKQLHDKDLHGLYFSPDNIRLKISCG
jgi:hypothetical protein